jgi:hypothetical protein
MHPPHARTHDATSLYASPSHAHDPLRTTFANPKHLSAEGSGALFVLLLRSQLVVELWVVSMVLIHFAVCGGFRRFLCANLIPYHYHNLKRS